MPISQNPQNDNKPQFFKDPKNIVIFISLTLNLILVTVLALWFFTPIFIWQTMAVDLPKFCEELSKNTNDPDLNNFYQKICQ